MGCCCLCCTCRWVRQREGGGAVLEMGALFWHVVGEQVAITRFVCRLG
jgi:hypothetical protein